MSSFERNWNGEGALPFSKKTIANVRKVLKSLKFRQPTVVPTTYGSIQIEFEEESGDYFQINVQEDDYLMFYFYSSKEAKEKRGTIKDAYDSINSFLNRKVIKELS